MYFATFYHWSVPLEGKPSRLIEACGDRATIILDGRESLRTHNAIAADECKKRGFVAYQLHKGESFTRVSKSLAVVRVDHLTDLQTVSERINARKVN